MHRLPLALVALMVLSVIAVANGQKKEIENGAEAKPVAAGDDAQIEGVAAEAEKEEGPATETAFSNAYPNAKLLDWGGSAKPPVRVLFDHHVIGAFDDAGGCIYFQKSSPYPGCDSGFGPPRALPLEDRSMAFCEYSGGPKTHVISIVLVGFHGGRAEELELPYSCASSYPTEYYYRTWLEDIDGDGQPELCRFYHYRLQCLEWDADEGQWQWLEERKGERIERFHAPVRWLVEARYEPETRTVKLTVGIKSLVTKPLILSQPLEPLFQEGGNWYRSNVGPEGENPRPVTVKTGLDFDHTDWKMTPKDEAGADLVLPPGGHGELEFEIQGLNAQKPRRSFNVCFVGRARWGSFEVNYLDQYTALLRGPEGSLEEPEYEPGLIDRAISGLASQDEMDAEIRRGVEVHEGVYVSGYITPFMSDEVRQWLIEQVSQGKSGLAVLTMDVADATRDLTVKALAHAAGMKPENVRQLLEVALERTDVDEYARLLERAGGAEAGLDQGLGLLLSDPPQLVDRLQLARAAWNLDVKDQLGETPLHHAAGRDDKEMATLLIKRGADVNAESKGGYTPLHCAVNRRHREMAVLLMENGAELNAKAERGRTPLHWAVDSGYEDMALLLIANGTDVNARTDEGWTPLYEAAWRGFDEVVRQLLAAGADVNARTRTGATPLHGAANTGIAELLVRNGANPNAITKTGWMPLHGAAQGGRKDVVELLIAEGADLDARTDHGMTALHWAAERGHTDVVELLVAKGARLEARNTHGRTALYWAADRGHRDVVKVLIANGAELEGRDKYGQTALHCAASGGHQDVVELLLASGADPNAVDNGGRTPLDLAPKKGHERVTELLMQHGAKK